MAVESWGSMAAHRSWIRAALTAAWLAAPPCALLAQTLAATSPAPVTTVAELHAQLRDVLTASRSSPAQREEAAKRLLSRRSNETRDILMAVLGSPDREAKVAVAKALADDPSPDPRFIPLLDSMLGPDRAATEAAATALARYAGDAPVRDRLLSFARDAKQPAASREPLIAALANVVNRAVANALVELVNDNIQPAAVRNAAGMALSEMTGLPYGRNGPQWRQWQARAPRDEAAWAAEVEAGRASHLQQIALRQSSTVGALERIINDRYQQDIRTRNEKDRADLIMDLLNEADPHARVMGINFVTGAFIQNQSFPAAAKSRIVELLGDSDSDVRLTAAKAAKTLNLVGAENDLLLQLPEEPNPDVREAMAAVLGVIKDPRATPVLRPLLSDASPRVATAAAGALREMAPQLRQADPQAAGNLAAELWRAGSQRAGNPAWAAFRAACIETIGLLGDTKLDRNLLGLADPINEEPQQVRISALRALGEMHSERAAAGIANFLQNEANANTDLRLEEIDALSKTGKFDAYAPLLSRYTAPNEEPNPRVRAAAWKAFTDMFPTASSTSLKEWSDRLRGDPKRQIELLKALTDKLAPANNKDDWAYEEQNLGAAYAADHHPELAAVEFQKAFGYWSAQRGELTQRTALLLQQLLTAYLDSRQYEAACKFAASQLRANRNRQNDVGPTLSNYVGSLIAAGSRDPQKIADAKELTALALKMEPALEGLPRSHLETYQSDLARAQLSPPGRSGG